MRPQGDAPALLALAAVLALAWAGYRLFPLAQHWVWREQCIASGRVSGC